MHPYRGMRPPREKDYPTFVQAFGFAIYAPPFQEIAYYAPLEKLFSKFNVGRRTEPLANVVLWWY